MSVFLQTAAPTFAVADIAKTKVETLSPPTRMPYGLVEFAVRDPNGYILVFGDDAPDADVPGVKEG